MKLPGQDWLERLDIRYQAPGWMVFVWIVYAFIVVALPLLVALWLFKGRP